MLTIRLQRTGRSGHAQFRVVVQDSRTAPSSGKVIALLGSYNPHTKEIKVNKEEAERFMANGAQPSERIVKLFTLAKVKLPEWVAKLDKKSAAIKNSEKLRRNQPKQPKVEAEAPVEAPAETEAEPVVEDTPTEAVSEEVPSEAPVSAEVPAES